MAPQAPRREAHHRSTRPLKSILKSGTRPPMHETESLFSNSKKDKRLIKHSQFISKITKPTVSKVRRRRPSKKLITTLDALGDALPDTETSVHSAKDSLLQQQANVITRKSMKSRPGAMKRRENIDKNERARFARNMAQLATSKTSKTSNGDSTASTSSAQVPSTSERWAALRGFISQTLETRPEIQAVKS